MIAVAAQNADGAVKDSCDFKLDHFDTDYRDDWQKPKKPEEIHKNRLENHLKRVKNTVRKCDHENCRNQQWHRGFLARDEIEIECRIRCFMAMK
ncbi:hypothetical protein [Hoeflea sp. AS16]|uniref:hypothetical protein n=1 Tax=unclassified Hoeflea TaxID=2614931 RepID=UPI00316C9A51